MAWRPNWPAPFFMSKRRLQLNPVRRKDGGRLCRTTLSGSMKKTMCLDRPATFREEGCLRTIPIRINPYRALRLIPPPAGAAGKSLQGRRFKNRPHHLRWHTVHVPVA